MREGPATSLPSPTDPVGSTARIGEYEIIGLLGTGGMGEVLLCRQSGPHGFYRPVVVKRIRSQLAEDPDTVRMFLDEARLASLIRHPNVVQVLEFGDHEDTYFMAMEYLAGETLSALIRQRTRETVLPYWLGAHIIAEVCAGLHAAHNLENVDGKPLHLVHRDISPSNVFITYDGTVKLLDFGVARAEGRLTETGQGSNVKGKYGYMSPEQHMHEPLDRRSDIFSLGVVLYELTTNRRLFRRAEPWRIRQAICEGDILPPSTRFPEYPQSLEDVCLKALHRDPAQRYSSAQDFRRALLSLNLRNEPGPELPEEQLATLMTGYFEDRLQRKRQHIAQLQAPGQAPQVSMGPFQTPRGSKSADSSTEESGGQPTWPGDADSKTTPIRPQATETDVALPMRSPMRWGFLLLFLMGMTAVGWLLFNLLTVPGPTSTPSEPLTKPPPASTAPPDQTANQAAETPPATPPPATEPASPLPTNQTAVKAPKKKASKSSTTRKLRRRARPRPAPPPKAPPEEDEPADSDNPYRKF